MDNVYVCKSDQGHAAHQPKITTRSVGLVRLDTSEANRSGTPTATKTAWDTWFEGEAVTADYLTDNK
ncbi:hypothetical protein LMG3458_01266 [Achromobacter deleyi]|uniref:Uncharacterized protein n=1 Tax=Achromobacter deleyi TaxID=1353891 RepID=A0A6S6ZGH8_9BURK|nr:hypothetical protein [Achromobacter deleyi]CAB3674307.1 hypothetical protein LMG3458_01266 [Achromobacter deleyi]CAB3836825.1 hypothetical protein LMG3481_01047 [Achromobacter deleyi]CAB3843134.1 hypothetical protein LMG3482_01370 [Achromobacter deleyi]